jgi:hypothetical protein
MIVLFVLRLSRVAATSMAAVGPDEHLRLIRARHHQRVRRMKGMRRGSPTQKQERT